jgi:CheY-like chemotaxis protein
VEGTFMKEESDFIISQLEKIAIKSEIGNLEKKTFLACMNHKLRTPMNSVLGMLRLLQDTPLNENQSAYVTSALDAANYMLSLIENIEIFTEDDEKLNIRTKIFELYSKSKEIITFFANKATANKIILSFNYEIEKHIFLKGDILKIQQILAKLLEYSIDLSTNTVEMKILTEQIDKKNIEINFIILSSIPENNNINVNKFFNFHDKNIAEDPQIHLELAVCKKIANNLQGNVSVSKHKNSFEISFKIPLKIVTESEMELISREKEKTEGLHDGKLKTFAGIKVLLAEDDPINQSLAVAFLEKLGAQVDTANDGIETLEKFRNEKYDMIFMDCEMPNLDGYTVTKKIRQDEITNNFKHTPIIAMTAYAARGDKERCIASGMDDHVPKPITVNVLNNIIEKFIVKL